jgi:hypothetical protein
VKAPLALLAGALVLAGPLEEASAEPAPARPWSAQLELLGRGGLWGVGGEREAGPVYAGAVGSFALLRGDQVYSACGYGGLRFGGPRHVLRVDVGVNVTHVRTPSPVPEWDGVTSTGAGSVIGVGYERRGALDWRLGALALVGKGGVVPWLSLSVAWRLPV